MSVLKAIFLTGIISSICSLWVSCSDRIREEDEDNVVDETADETVDEASSLGNLEIASTLNLSGVETIAISQVGDTTDQFIGIDNLGQPGTLDIYVDPVASLKLTATQPAAKDLVLTEKFIFFLFTHEASCAFVALRKSDSSLFCVDEKPVHNEEYFFTGNRGIVQLDDNENIYFVSIADGEYKLTKVDVGNASEPTKTELYTTTNLNSFIVNGSGDTLVYSQDDGTKIIKSSGAIQNVAASGWHCGFIGFDGEIYYVKAGSSDVQKLTRQGDGSYVDTVHASGNIESQMCGNGTVKTVCQTDGEIFYGYPYGDAYRLYNNPGPIGLQAEGFAEHSNIRCSDGFA